jgi:hypothetical protein
MLKQLPSLYCLLLIHQSLVSFNSSALYGNQLSEDGLLEWLIAVGLVTVIGSISLLNSTRILPLYY